MDKQPAYVKVYNALKASMLEGEYQIGDLLPTEPELEKMFSVSRTTVRRAIEILAREGFLEARQGRGTQVLNYNTQQNLNAVTSMSETLERKGYHVYPKSMYIDRVEASAKLSKELEVPVGSELVRIQRIQMADDSPIAIMHNYLRPEFVPNIEAYSGKFTRLYDFLEEQYGLIIEQAKDRITARSASFSEAEMLHVPVGTALVYLIRNCYTQGGKVFCADHVSIIGGRYEFEVTMMGRTRHRS